MELRGSKGLEMPRQGCGWFRELGKGGQRDRGESRTTRGRKEGISLSAKGVGPQATQTQRKKARAMLGMFLEWSRARTEAYREVCPVDLSQDE